MPLCTLADTDLIFAAVKGYTVECCGEILSTTLDMNRRYYDFDIWIIKRPDGILVSKKPIRCEIEKVKIKDIEVNWCTKYENDWADEVQKIERLVLGTAEQEIPAFDKEYLMCFFIAIDWRGFCSNQMFETTYNTLVAELADVDIPEKECLLPSLRTAADEMRHSLLLQYYRKFLDDTGVIYQDAMANLKKQFSFSHF